MDGKIEKMKKIYLTIFKKSSFVDRNKSFRTSASFEDRNASNFMFIYTRSVEYQSEMDMNAVNHHR